MRTKRQPALPPAPTHDAWGIPIQPHARKAFDEVPHFELLSATIADVRSRTVTLLACEAGAHLLAMRNPSVLELIDKAADDIRKSMPTLTVCPMTFADVPHGQDCPVCMGRNWTGTNGIECAKPGWRNGSWREAPGAAEAVRRMKAHYGIE